jgi:uncharacterized protein YegP (UPF0339 family)
VNSFRESELFKDTAGQFRRQLNAANGEIIAASRGYTSKAAAQNGIASVATNAATAPTEDLTRHQAQDGRTRGLVGLRVATANV